MHLFLMHKKQKRINARRIPPRFLPRTCANSLLLRLSHTHLSGAVALQGPFSGLFVAPPIPRVAPRCVVAVAVRLCAPVVPNADRTPGLRKRLFINDPSSHSSRLCGPTSQPLLCLYGTPSTAARGGTKCALPPPPAAARNVHCHCRPRRLQMCGVTAARGGEMCSLKPLSCCLLFVVCSTRKNKHRLRR